MIIYTDAEALRKALLEVRPKKIAVAYVGIGWDKFINVSELEEIIISPTIGSNPKAIEQIINLIPIANLHFLDSLHSKLYLGENSALIGSSNLSKNGFANGGNLELGCLIEGEKEQEALRDYFSELRLKAVRLYPTNSAKRKKLEELKRQWRNARLHKVPSFEDETITSLAAYPVGTDTIHIAWFNDTEFDLDEKCIREAIPESADEPIGKYFHEWAQFTDSDCIAEGDWLLLWRSRKDGYPVSNQRLSWMRVDKVIPGGASDEEYSLLAAQASPHSKADEPFSLEGQTADVIKELLKEKHYAALRPRIVDGEVEVWNLAEGDKLVLDFLEQAKTRVKQK